MTALARLLFPLPDVRRSPGTLLLWWERRRPVYNAMVGGAGIITMGVLRMLELLPPHLGFTVPWQLVVLYGVLANLCYSLGFAFEILLHRLWGEQVLPAGPVLFRQGLAFSVGLTLLPIMVAWLGWLAQALRYLAR